MVGCGDAFTHSKGNTSGLITYQTEDGNIRKILLDCGYDVPVRIANVFDEIDTIIITHIHADHAGGLEEVAFRTAGRPKDKRINLVVTEGVYQQLEASMSLVLKSFILQDRLNTPSEEDFLHFPLRRFFNVHRQSSYSLPGCSVSLIDVPHSFGLESTSVFLSFSTEEGSKGVWWSGDVAKVVPEIGEKLTTGDWLFHEVHYGPHSPVHTSEEDLCKFVEDRPDIKAVFMHNGVSRVEAEGVGPSTVPKGAIQAIQAKRYIIYDEKGNTDRKSHLLCECLRGITSSLKNSNRSCFETEYYRIGMWCNGDEGKGNFTLMVELLLGSIPLEEAEELKFIIEDSINILEIGISSIIYYGIPMGKSTIPNLDDQGKICEEVEFIPKNITPTKRYQEGAEYGSDMLSEGEHMLHFWPVPFTLKVAKGVVWITTPKLSGSYKGYVELVAYILNLVHDIKRIVKIENLPIKRMAIILEEEVKLLLVSTGEFQDTGKDYLYLDVNETTNQ